MCVCVCELNSHTCIHSHRVVHAFTLSLGTPSPTLHPLNPRKFCNSAGLRAANGPAYGHAEGTGGAAGPTAAAPGVPASTAGSDKSICHRMSCHTRVTYAMGVCSVLYGMHYDIVSVRVIHLHQNRLKRAVCRV